MAALAEPGIRRGSQHASRVVSTIPRKRERPDDEKVRLCKRIEGTPDGRVCAGPCSQTDLSDDPVDAAVFDVRAPRSWGGPARKGKQQGKYCYYCVAMYTSRFRVRGTDIGAFFSAPGSEGEQFEKFMSYLKKLIQFLCEHGGRQCRAAWADIDKLVVSHTTRNIVAIKEADDELWSYDYCVSTKGDPATDNLGHVVTEEFGRKEVKVPTAPIRRIVRHTEQVVDQTRTLVDSHSAFYQGQEDEMVQELLAITSLPVARGYFAEPSELGAASSSGASGS